MRMWALSLAFQGCWRVGNRPLLPLVASAFHCIVATSKGDTPLRGGERCVCEEPVCHPEQWINSLGSVRFVVPWPQGWPMALGFPFPEISGVDYKSVVLVLLSVGCDSLHSSPVRLLPLGPVPLQLDNAGEPLLLLFLFVLWGGPGRSSCSYFCLWGRNWCPGKWMTFLISWSRLELELTCGTKSLDFAGCIGRDWATTVHFPASRSPWGLITSIVTLCLLVLD